MGGKFCIHCVTQPKSIENTEKKQRIRDNVVDVLNRLLNIDVSGDYRPHSFELLSLGGMTFIPNRIHSEK